MTVGYIALKLMVIKKKTVGILHLTMASLNRVLLAAGNAI
ncbi:hypothetical protein MNB_SUP05-4-580 [hydrothermal vent metagenome]|uniref:Uncharacterized protein n=1 Tax=hydrothermal vent metagenome TaxID=652676 RepID=A0A1W1D925_9ZZZZ